MGASEPVSRVEKITAREFAMSSSDFLDMLGLKVHSVPCSDHQRSMLQQRTMLQPTHRAPQPTHRAPQSACEWRRRSACGDGRIHD